MKNSLILLLFFKQNVSEHTDKFHQTCQNHFLVIIHRCKSAEASLTHVFWTCPTKMNLLTCKVVFKSDKETTLFGHSVSLLDHNDHGKRCCMVFIYAD